MVRLAPSDDLGLRGFMSMARNPGRGRSQRRCRRPTLHFSTSPSRDGKPPRALPAGSRSVPYRGLHQVPPSEKLPTEVSDRPTTRTLAVSHFS